MAAVILALVSGQAPPSPPVLNPLKGLPELPKYHFSWTTPPFYNE